MTMAMPEPLQSSKPPLRVALCQIETAHGDLHGNTIRTRAALLDAARQGAQLAIAPESVLQGYPPMNTETERAYLRSIATPVGGEAIRDIRNIAAEHRMAVAIGFSELAPHGMLHNSSLLVGPDGSILIHYRKVHCRPFESIDHEGLYKPGKTFPVVPLPVSADHFRVGMYICFDREIPESTRCLRALGAELVVCPLATNTSRLDQPAIRADNEMITRVRAAENELFIAVVNHAGIYNGGSFVVGPSGECLLQLGSGHEVRTIDLDVGILRESFHNRPWGWAGWGYRRNDVYTTAMQSADKERIA